MRVLFSPGLNDTILFKDCKYCKQLVAIVGDIKSNHCIDVINNTGEYIVAILKEFVEGRMATWLMKLRWKYYPLKKNPGMCPYFILVGNPKTINKRNEFGQVDLGICEEASG